MVCRRVCQGAAPTAVSIRRQVGRRQPDRNHPGSAVARAKILSVVAMISTRMEALTRYPATGSAGESRPIFLKGGCARLHRLSHFLPSRFLSHHPSCTTLAVSTGAADVSSWRGRRRQVCMVPYNMVLWLELWVRTGGLLLPTPLT